MEPKEIPTSTVKLDIPPAEREQEDEWAKRRFAKNLEAAKNGAKDKIARFASLGIDVSLSTEDAWKALLAGMHTAQDLVEYYAGAINLTDIHGRYILSEEAGDKLENAIRRH